MASKETTITIREYFIHSCIPGVLDEVVNAVLQVNQLIRPLEYFRYNISFSPATKFQFEHPHSPKPCKKLKRQPLWILIPLHSSRAIISSYHPKFNRFLNSRTLVWSHSKKHSTLGCKWTIFAYNYFFSVYLQQKYYTLNG